MTVDQALVEILDEAVRALDDLDSERLHALEQRVVVLTKSNGVFERDGIGLLLSKRHQLEIILQNFRVNLEALIRLHTRNTRNRWAQ
jgi:hypothetical protein